ncbi:MAG: flagellar basal body rod protein FlgB [Chloroflexi bacterium]|nr:flagellar basal body rod protein FlgB [Chloroflexota bacterium]
MEITNSRDDRLIRAALTGLSERQRAISDNVANADTPEFKASRVSFETALKHASGQTHQPLPMFEVPNAVAGPGAAPVDVTPEVHVESTTSRRNDGNNVDIDQEMTELADTNLRFNALIQQMGSKLQTLRYVINDGRR